MPDRLLIRLDRNGGLTWLRQSPDGRMLSSSQNGVPPTSVTSGAAEIVVLVPAEDVLVTSARVHARSSAQRAQAIPFAVEDQLLGVVEDQHFAIQESSADKVGVAVVSRQRLREWTDQLAAAGIRADVVIPESLALAARPTGASILVDGDRAIARLTDWSAMACATADLPAWLDMTDEADSEREIEIFQFGEATDLGLQIPEGAHHAGLKDPLAFLARQFREPGINLLGGEFASAHRHARAARWWRRAAAIAALIAVLAFAHRALEVSQLSRSIERIDTAMSDSLLRTFPDLGAAERTRAPQSVMRDRLERLRGGDESSGLLRVLGQVAPVLGRTTRTQMRGLEFRNGILELGLRSPDVATLDNLREQFSAIPGLVAEVTASVPAETGVDGRIRIRGVEP
ncbi:type II secretion system protein GspL [Dokdonella sp.]|uniref:type II secretion system protein GspL n=1 Tax=Dokdonella sp. TaxID=2291710 RepID=UPI003527C04A